MDLVERYVGEVGRRVPASKRDDVVAELRSAILDALEGRGARDDDDVVAVLREFGAPAVVAASYHPEGQYLIGPELYPTFVHTVKLVLSSVPLVAGAWFTVELVLSGDMYESGQLLEQAARYAVSTALLAIVVVTGVFVLLQRHAKVAAARATEWDPRTLSDVLAADRAPRRDSLVSFLAAAIVIALLNALGAAGLEEIAEVPAAYRALAGGVILLALPLLIGSLAVEAVMWCVVLAEGRWRTWTRVVRALGDALAVAAFGTAALVTALEAPELRAGGVPERGIVVAVATLLVIALGIALETLVREVRARRARVRERAELSGRSADPAAARGDSPPTRPTAPAARA